MLHYIIQTIAFQLFFLIIYDVFLKKETFFNWNRAYLLITALLSVVLPFIKIESFKETIPQQFIIQLPQVIIGSLTQTQSNLLIESNIESASKFVFSWELFLGIGIVIAFAIFIYKLIKIFVLIHKNPKHWQDHLRIVKLINSNAAFSFFHYVFLGEYLNNEDKDAIIKHESIHVKQKHTLDLLVFEMLRILFWFNPLVYIYQNRVRTLHEYIADAKAVKTLDKSIYYENLLAQVFETQNVSFINTFFKQSLIKKRIVMLAKSRSKQIFKLKYVLLVPLVFVMLLYTSSNAQEKLLKEEVNQELTDAQLKEKLYNEISTLSEEDFMKKMNEYMPDLDKYILSREQLFKREMYFKVLLDRRKAIQKQKGEEVSNDPILKYNTYAEYLEWKKTDEAKERWESNIKDGVLRLVVNRLGNFTEEEQKRFDKKMEMIKKDKYFKKLLIDDLKGFVKITLEYPESNSKKESSKDKIIKEEIEVPFGVIDEVPVFPGCETLTTNTERRKCMAEKITKFVQQNFNTDLAGDLGLTGRQRINVVFKIDADGNVIGIRSRAPHPKLEEEAKRVIGLLPKMSPGKQNGEAVIVPYSLPIIFQVATKATTSKEKVVNKKEANHKMNNEESKHKLHKDWVLLEETIIEPKDYSNDGDIPYAIVENAPVYPGCENLLTNKETKKCTSNGIDKFVQKNFNTDLAVNLGLTGRQRVNTIFKIDKEGNVTDIRSRAVNPRLEEEAKRVIRLLPIMIPGKHNGENVKVAYSLPIIFQVQ
jgi:BlaR1 peptidase M56/Gram-negative bacterial TonB protein C-terminal